MHTVIDALCTGCELCMPACPVDCIALVPVTGERTGWQAWSAAQASLSRATPRLPHVARLERDAREQAESMRRGRTARDDRGPIDEDPPTSNPSSRR